MAYSKAIEDDLLLASKSDVSGPRARYALKYFKIWMTVCLPILMPFGSEFAPDGTAYIFRGSWRICIGELSCCLFCCNICQSVSRDVTMTKYVDYNFQVTAILSKLGRNWQVFDFL